MTTSTIITTSLHEYAFLTSPEHKYALCDLLTLDLASIVAMYAGYDPEIHNIIEAIKTRDFELVEYLLNYRLDIENTYLTYVMCTVYSNYVPNFQAGHGKETKRVYPSLYMPVPNAIHDMMEGSAVSVLPFLSPPNIGSDMVDSIINLTRLGEFFLPIVGLTDILVRYAIECECSRFLSFVLNRLEETSPHQCSMVSKTVITHVMIREYEKPVKQYEMFCLLVDHIRSSDMKTEQMLCKTVMLGTLDMVKYVMNTRVDPATFNINCDAGKILGCALKARATTSIIDYLVSNGARTFCLI